MRTKISPPKKKLSDLEQSPVIFDYDPEKKKTIIFIFLNRIDKPDCSGSSKNSGYCGEKENYPLFDT